MSGRANAQPVRRPAVLIALCVLGLVGCAKPEDKASVEAAVVHSYRAHAHHRALRANCDHGDDNPDATEWWWCDLEVDAPMLDDSDICTADVKRHASGAVTVVRFVDCFSDWP